MCGGGKSVARVCREGCAGGKWLEGVLWAACVIVISGGVWGCSGGGGGVWGAVVGVGNGGARGTWAQKEKQAVKRKKESPREILTSTRQGEAQADK